MIASPLQEALDALHRRFLHNTDGEVATYIPELGRADPALFGISVVTVDGQRYGAGDTSQAFTIQSISKPFVYACAIEDRGFDEVLRKIGIEPSGEAFNAISLEPESGRPRNPMINAGAITSASLVAGETSSEKLERATGILSAFAGRSLSIDFAVYESERDTGHRNRAIAYLLRNAGIVGDDVDDALDRYFRQCSVLVSTDDLAVMAATLANGGVNPITGERALDQAHVSSVLSVMSTCGMYDYAGSWLLRVGMPAKSGVAGGIIAVLPGQLGIGVYSPALDQFGNSVRGIAVCEAFSQEFGLHLLRPPVHPASVVAATYALRDVSSKRRRSEAELAYIAERGDSVRIVRLQGSLVFSTAEVALRRAAAADHDASTVLFDCKRVQSIDDAACALFDAFVVQVAADRGAVVFAELREGAGWERLASTQTDAGTRFFPTLDLALEWCEDVILGGRAMPDRSHTEISIDDHPLLSALTRHERAATLGVMRRESFDAGTRIVRQGDPANCLYLLTSGDVSVHVGLEPADAYRLATLGPGAVFGEFALLDDQERTASVHAETDVTCWALDRIALPALAAAAPAARLKLTENLARDLASRLRRADNEIAALAK